MSLTDRLAGRRQLAAAAVRFIASPAALGRGTVTHVSLRGAFLDTDLAIAQGSLLRLECMRPAKVGRRKRLSARVVRRMARGALLQWCEPVSTAMLFAQFGAACRDLAEFGWSAPPDTPAPYPNATTYHYRFDFTD